MTPDVRIHFIPEHTRLRYIAQAQWHSKLIVTCVLITRAIFQAQNSLFSIIIALFASTSHPILYKVFPSTRASISCHKSRRHILVTFSSHSSVVCQQPRIFIEGLALTRHYVIAHFPCFGIGSHHVIRASTDFLSTISCLFVC